MVGEDARGLTKVAFPAETLLKGGGEVHRCIFADLRDPVRTEQARRCAATAQVILFALSSPGDLPAEVKSWIESWLHRREAREGTLVGLILDRPALRGTSSVAELYLRHTARRAGMDYLSQLPRTFGRSIPDSLESYGKRAGYVTSVLHEILDARQLPTPPR